jgi:hypothetical protein
MPYSSGCATTGENVQEYCCDVDPKKKREGNADNSSSDSCPASVDPVSVLLSRFKVPKVKQ